MRVNLGCGDRYADGWWNVDLASCPYRKDEVIDLTGELPWVDQSLTHVYAGHVLEHLAIEDATDLCRQLRTKLVPSGLLMIVGPDCDIAEALIPLDGNDEYGATRDSLEFGGHRWPGDEHQWRSTGPRTEAILEAAGWVSWDLMRISEVAAEWPVADRNPQWQFGLLAVNL